MNFYLELACVVGVLDVSLSTLKSESKYLKILK